MRIECQERVARVRVPRDDLVPGRHRLVLLVLVGHRLPLTRGRRGVKQSLEREDVPTRRLVPDERVHLPLRQVTTHEDVGCLPSVLRSRFREHVLVVDHVVLHHPRAVRPLEQDRAHRLEPEREGGHHRGEQVLLHVVRVQPITDHHVLEHVLGENALRRCLVKLRDDLYIRGVLDDVARDTSNHSRDVT